MITEAVQIDIHPVPFSAIMDDPAFPDLLEAYADECSVPDAAPQRAIYEKMERAGVLHCFAAYSFASNSDPNFSPLLVGFISILTAEMPHGRRLATTESLFVDPDYRHTGAGFLLLDAAEAAAAAAGCSDFVATARIGSAFDKLLSRRAGYALTHLQHTRRLQ